MADGIEALPLNEWFQVRFDETAIHLAVSPPGRKAWESQIDWQRIVRVCFKAGDWMDLDEIYLFTDERPESYLIPTLANGGAELWGEIIRRKLFDAELAITAATATGELFCCPSATE